TIITAALVALLRATLTHANSIAIVGATIIDGTGAIPKPDGVILVEGERFSAVGAAGKVAIPEGATRIDATGKYVIPGLLDANVHLLLDVEAEPLVKYEGHYDDLIIEAAQLTLRNGVTTVFDTWGPRESLVRARDRVNHGESVGSRFFIGGNIIGFDGPFSSDFLQRGILSSEFVNRTNDAWEQGVGGDLLWRTPEQVGEHVRHYIARGGIDFLKYASSGHTQERLIAFSPEAQRAIVDEGRKAGLIVQAHSTSVESLRLEIAAGVNLMQHCDVTGPEPIPA